MSWWIREPGKLVFWLGVSFTIAGVLFAVPWYFDPDGNYEPIIVMLTVTGGLPNGHPAYGRV